MLSGFVTLQTTYKEAKTGCSRTPTRPVCTRCLVWLTDTPCCHQYHRGLLWLVGKILENNQNMPLSFAVHQHHPSSRTVTCTHTQWERFSLHHLCSSFCSFKREIRRLSERERGKFGEESAFSGKIYFRVCLSVCLCEWWENALPTTVVRGCIAHGSEVRKCCHQLVRWWERCSDAWHSFRRECSLLGREEVQVDVMALVDGWYDGSGRVTVFDFVLKY